MQQQQRERSNLFAKRFVAPQAHGGGQATLSTDIIRFVPIAGARPTNSTHMWLELIFSSFFNATLGAYSVAALRPLVGDFFIGQLHFGTLMQLCECEADGQRNPLGKRFSHLLICSRRKYCTTTDRRPRMQGVNYFDGI